MKLLLCHNHTSVPTSGTPVKSIWWYPKDAQEPNY
jgi:hypothetical protein